MGILKYENSRRKCALVTGASSGIGAEICKHLARQGFNVALLARRQERLQCVLQALECAVDQKHIFVSADVTSVEDLGLALARIERDLGQLDVLVANAGFGVMGRFESLDIKDYERQYSTNVVGTLNTIKAFLPLLKSSKGAVGIVGSIGGVFGMAGGSAYAMSKASLHAFARILRLELKEFEVSVTLAIPGCVNTEIWKVDKYGKFKSSRAEANLPAFFFESVDRVAEKIVVAVLTRKREVTTSMSGVVMTLLFRFFPGLMANAIIPKMSKLIPIPMHGDADVD